MTNPKINMLREMCLAYMSKAAQLTSHVYILLLTS
ncbi:hypothetical protein SAMN03097699_2524 [Flavobacteriaceae bacterium MAR_2010_188]|nr:hypothetical protein SAMN03097699_2524 [Flavobacteriaceae bacterium MAR_2010_188]